MIFHCHSFFLSVQAVHEGVSAGCGVVRFDGVASAARVDLAERDHEKIARPEQSPLAAAWLGICVVYHAL